MCVCVFVCYGAGGGGGGRVNGLCDNSGDTCLSHGGTLDAGAGTMGIEILDQVGKVDAIVVPVGGCGLIAGVSMAVKTLSPSTWVRVGGGGGGCATVWTCKLNVSLQSSITLMGMFRMMW